jgi:hypothetical protein
LICLPLVFALFSFAVIVEGGYEVDAWKIRAFSRDGSVRPGAITTFTEITPLVLSLEQQSETAHHMSILKGCKTADTPLAA